MSNFNVIYRFSKWMKIMIYKEAHALFTKKRVEIVDKISTRVVYKRTKFVHKRSTILFTKEAQNLFTKVAQYCLQNKHINSLFLQILQNTMNFNIYYHILKII